MALWTAVIWQQRLLGHWIYQKRAAPKNDPPVVHNDETRSSSRAMGNVHHLLMRISIMIKIAENLDQLRFCCCNSIIRIAERVTDNCDWSASAIISPSLIGHSWPSSALKRVSSACRFFRRNAWIWSYCSFESTEIW